jgi:hypothetical protein
MPGADWTLLAALFGWNGVSTSSTYFRVLKRSDGLVRLNNGTPNAAARVQLTGGVDTSLKRVWLRPNVFGVVASSGPANTAMSMGDRILVPVQNACYEAQANGTTGPAAPTWGTTAGGITTESTGLQWKHLGDSRAVCPDMTFFPFKVPDAWLTSVDTFFTAGPWTELPRMTATGTFTTDASVTVRGEVTEAEAVRWQESGVWQAGERLTFTLREV